MITTAFLLRRSWLAVSIAVICLALSVPAAAQGPVGTFERTLKVSGSADVSVQSGSGSIRVEPGAVDRVRVAARIKAGSSWLVGGDVEKRVRQIEQNPPIEQQGNVIRIGWFADDDLPRNISITYEITVPAATKLAARTGSGSIVVGAIAGPVEVKSGSGSLTVGRVGAQVAASTGSGSIRVEGAGGLEASTGSGSIHAASVAGPTKATSGSGSITIDGRPSGPWTLHASSGGITMTVPPDASFNLDARTNSGSIDSAHPVTMEVTGKIDKRRIAGKVRGGGPLIEASCASGSIRIR